MKIKDSRALIIKNNVSDHNKLLVAQNICNLWYHAFFTCEYRSIVKGIKLTGHP